MKIKTKKQLNLPQFIEWAWENLDKVQSESFISNVSDIFGNYSTVHFSVDGYGFRTDGVANDDTFTVEVEEEITEDTEFKELICLGVDGKYCSYGNLCVLDFDKDRVRAIYIPNDDLTMTLIWRNGKLVE